MICSQWAVAQHKILRASNLGAAPAGFVSKLIISRKWLGEQLTQGCSPKPQPWYQEDGRTVWFRPRFSSGFRQRHAQPNAHQRPQQAGIVALDGWASRQFLGIALWNCIFWRPELCSAKKGFEPSPVSKRTPKRWWTRVSDSAPGFWLLWIWPCSWYGKD